MIGNAPYYGSYTVGGLTATAGTAIVALIPPSYGDGDSPPQLFTMQAGSSPGSSSVGTFGTKYTPGWMKGTGAKVARIVSLNYTVGADAHVITILRPLNFVYTTAAVAASATAFPVSGDPGVYSTNYGYALPGGTGTANGPTGPVAADDAVAANDYVAYQLVDGTWVYDTVASYSNGTLTMNTGTPAGGGCYALSPVFLFGAAATATDIDPATGLVQPSYTTGTSATTQIIGNLYAGGVAALHRGDPLLVYSNNVTAAGTLQELTAVYARY